MNRSKINRRNGNALKISQQLPWSQPPAPVGAPPGAARGCAERPSPGCSAGRAAGIHQALTAALRGRGGGERGRGRSAPRRGRNPPKLPRLPRSRLLPNRQHIFLIYIFFFNLFFCTLTHTSSSFLLFDPGSAPIFSRLVSFILLYSGVLSWPAARTGAL